MRLTSGSPAQALTVPAALLFACLGIFGCGSAPSPVDQMAASQAAIRAAEEDGAAKDPQAALHLKLAHEQFDKAKALMDSNENEVALRLLLRTEADADVARAFAKKVAAIAAAEEAEKQVDKLKGSK